MSPRSFLLVAVLATAPACLAQPLTGVVQVASGSLGSCALTVQGTVKCWGNETRGDGTGLTSSPLPIDVPLLPGVTQIAVNGYHACALSANGLVKCWGTGEGGLIPGYQLVEAAYPMDVPELPPAKYVGLGINHSCAVLVGGALRCWGFLGGMIPGADQHGTSPPVAVPGLDTGVKTVTGGISHTCALLEVGTVKCWGSNTFGQLGDSTTSYRTTPVDVVGLSNVKAITAAWAFTCALTQPGGVKCWGANERGSIGDGTTTNRLVPTNVVGLSSGVTAISAFEDHVCAVLEDGSVKCWGGNTHGQLGDGTHNNSAVPVDVQGGFTAGASIASGEAHTCAVTVELEVRCWGEAGFGQLGDGGTTDTTAIVTVLAGVRTVANYQDMWWAGPAENGWGMSLTQHGEMLFGGIYVYDAAGNPTWFVMPGGSWDAGKTVFTGSLYRPRGSSYLAYDATKLVAGAPIGTLALSFRAADAATARFEMTNPVAVVTKSIQRQPIAIGPGYATDLWWGGESQNGWGIAITQYWHTFFAVWYTYDANGDPTWFVLPDGVNDLSNGPVTGALYATKGSSWFSGQYDPNKLAVTQVGSMTLGLGYSTGTLDYTVNGVSQSKSISRQPF